MSSVELRKDLFADERSDDLKEIGRPTIRQDIIGHVKGTTVCYTCAVCVRHITMPASAAYQQRALKICPVFIAWFCRRMSRRI